MATAIKSTPSKAQRGDTLRTLFQTHDFRLLWIGQGTSLLGDQFFLIAMPWLVLKLTGDPVSLGIVMALMGIPRALFMLVGGAITDRFSSRQIMILSDLIRLILIALLTVIVLLGQVQLWMLYVLALALGTVSGFFLPASNAIMPRLVPSEHLQTANAVFQGTAQLSIFVGPALAGALIALASGSASTAPAAPSTADMTGMGIAFGLDVLTFIVSIVTLWQMNFRPVSMTENNATRKQSVFAAIGENLRFAWKDPLLRMVFIIIGGMNLLFPGPLFVGIPVLANTRLPEGAAAFGLIIAAYGGGNFIGYIVAGATNASKHMGWLVSFILGAFGVGMILTGFAYSTAVVFAIFLAMGIGNGVIYILLVTWLQKRTPPALLGRMMSLLLFFNMGLMPASQFLCGVLIKWSVIGVFGGAGILILLITLRSALMPEMRMMGDELAAESKFKPA